MPCSICSTHHSVVLPHSAETERCHWVLCLPSIPHEWSVAQSQCLRHCLYRSSLCFLGERCTFQWEERKYLIIIVVLPKLLVHSDTLPKVVCTIVHNMYIFIRVIILLHTGWSKSLEIPEFGRTYLSSKFEILHSKPR